MLGLSVEEHRKDEKREVEKFQWIDHRFMSASESNLLVEICKRI